MSGGTTWAAPNNSPEAEGRTAVVGLLLRLAEEAHLVGVTSQRGISGGPAKDHGMTDLLSGILLDTGALEFLPFALTTEPLGVEKTRHLLLGVRLLPLRGPESVLSAAQCLFRTSGIWAQGV